MRDYYEEDWPSMNLCAEMLAHHLRNEHADRLVVSEFCPPFRARLQRLPWLGKRRGAFNTDRLLNRMWDYPRHMRRRQGDADIFHVVDHSYAQLVHVLPTGRVGVYCHDLDAFRCLLEPCRERRPRWFRAVARRILGGLKRAAVVFHSTAAVRAAIERHGLVDPARLVHASYGFAPEFRRDPVGDEECRLVGPHRCDGPYLLHVGSCIPRKRVDLLLRAFMVLRTRFPDLRLVKVGGQWTTDQRALLTELTGTVTHVTGIDRPALAALYRHASLVMMPSEAEGFGLPVLEALACGAPVLCSDLPVFREVGGDVAHYAPVGDMDAWTSAATCQLGGSAPAESAEKRVEWAQRFSWRRHAQIIADAYLGLMR
jgi:glycosyltransferase involved in cell wall biosynthesis